MLLSSIFIVAEAKLCLTYSFSLDIRDLIYRIKTEPTLFSEFCALNHYFGLVFAGLVIRKLTFRKDILKFFHIFMISSVQES